MESLDRINEFTGMQFKGVLIGFATFLIIGAYHPLVIKGEYYFGKKINYAFAVLGIVTLILALRESDIVWSALLGVISFSSFWSIKEVCDQVERVRKGWFPANPKKKAKRK